MSEEMPGKKHQTVGQNVLAELFESLGKNLLEKWYPLVVDKANGGYYTDISYDWKILLNHHKMIVTQARHVWTASKAAHFFDSDLYAGCARHGFDFLRKKMWDQQFGGFYQMRDHRGGTSDYLGFFEEKRTYGNAFAIYALAALYKLTGDDKVLEFAKEAFSWIKEHAFDPEFGGYFQFLTREGKPYGRGGGYKTKAYDDVEVGYKDQNSSIHLLEAYTELYDVWHDETLKEKLKDLLTLIRDVITTPKGHMNLFFEYNWTPVSFRNAPKETREKYFRLDHISFGHDCETAFLMLEASYALGLENDTETLTVTKRMVDHALANGWDRVNGGFWEAAYYFPDDDQCTIIEHTKNWWAQAEGLNVLLIMSKLFPAGEYEEYFLKQWNYIKNYLLDHEHGDWYEGGLDKEPHFKTGPKGHIWKAAYHTGRALMNSTKVLARDFPDLSPGNKGFVTAASDFNDFIDHWKNVACSVR